MEQERLDTDTAVVRLESTAVPDSPCWSTPPSPVCLPLDVVHVWSIALDVDDETVERLNAVLWEDERERAACFRFAQDRRHFITGRGALRMVLGLYLNRQPEALVFDVGTYGKPELAMASDLRFNLSHAGGLALIAVTRDRAIGVDVEPVRALPEADAIVERFFSAREVDVYRSLPTPARPEAFFTCWTRKEAFIKALGDGLTYPLHDFDVSVLPGEPARLLCVRGRDTPPQWHLAALPVGPGYAATVAVQGAPCVITYWGADALVSPRYVLA